MSDKLVQVIVLQRGTSTPEEISYLKEMTGLAVIESDDPDKFRVVNGFSEVEGGIMLKAALDAMASASEKYEHRAALRFVKTLAEDFKVNLQ